MTPAADVPFPTQEVVGGGGFPPPPVELDDHPVHVPVFELPVSPALPADPPTPVP